MRLAVQDLRTSHIRKRAQRLGRRELWMLYQELLWALYENGGELSSDPEVLADEVGFFSPEEITELLPLMAPGDGKRGGIVVEGRRIRNPRVSDEVKEAQTFSQEQALRGRHGGLAKHLAQRSTRQANASKLLATVQPSVSSSSSSSSSVGRKEDGSPALPPADRTERAIQATTDGLRTKLYALVDQAVQVDPKKRDPVELMRIFTGYTKADGRAVNGVVNAALLTHERLEKSVADAEATVAEWRHGTA